MESVGCIAGIRRAGSMTKRRKTKEKAEMKKAKARAKDSMEKARAKDSMEIEAKLKRDRRLKDEMNQREGSRSKCIRRNSKGTAKFLIKH